jgi:serine/threonine protein kinase
MDSNLRRVKICPRCGGHNDANAHSCKKIYETKICRHDLSTVPARVRDSSTVPARVDDISPMPINHVETVETGVAKPILDILFLELMTNPNICFEVRDGNTVGRAIESDVVLAGTPKIDWVSRRMARFFKRGSQWYVKNAVLPPTNFIQVDGERYCDDSEIAIGEGSILGLPLDQFTVYLNKDSVRLKEESNLSGINSILRVEDTPTSEADPFFKVTRRVELLESKAPINPRIVSDDPQASSTQQHISSTQRHILGHLDKGSILFGQYTVITTKQAHESARPGVYLCDSPSGHVIVKVAAANFPPPKDLFEKLKQLKHPNVLRTISTTEENGHYYEVQEYCAGGSLADRLQKLGTGLGADVVFFDIVPSLLSGIEYLHYHGIIHRDIKPANIYIRYNQQGTEEFVLGDFDVSSILGSTSTVGETERLGVTWTYCAPEAFPRYTDDSVKQIQCIISRKTDYYSLGMTLIALIIGITSLDSNNLSNSIDFYMQGKRVQIPEILTSHQSLLLQGILIRNYEKRWSAEETNRWLREETTEADRQLIIADRLADGPTPAHREYPGGLGRYRPKDLLSLAQAILAEPQIAESHLLEAEALVNWVGEIDADTEVALNQDRKIYRNQPSLALLCASLRCDPTLPFVFPDNKGVLTPEEWAEQAEKYLRANDPIASQIVTNEWLKRLEIWLERKTKPQVELQQKVANIVETPMHLRLEELQYIFDPDRPYPVTRNRKIDLASTPQQIVRMAYGEEKDWVTGIPPHYEHALRRWQQGYLNAWLRHTNGLSTEKKEELLQKIGLPRTEPPKTEATMNQTENTAQQKTEPDYAAFERILRILNPKHPPVKVEISPVDAIKAPWGNSLTTTVTYQTIGVGVPCGTINFENLHPGLTINDPLIVKRQGTIEIVLNTRDVGAGREHSTVLKMEKSRITGMEPASLPISYKAEMPVAKLAYRIVFYALVCAFFLGLTRAAIGLLGSDKAVRINDFSLGDTWSKTLSVNFPHWTMIPIVVLIRLIFCGIYKFFLHDKKIKWEE